MSIISCASSDSIWRGYDYYQEKRVKSYEETKSGQYVGMVLGSDNALYMTSIDIAHPRKSTCDCHAAGRRVICKHMIALYFTVFPEEATKLYEEAVNYEIEEEHRQQELREEVIRYVRHMKKDELQETVIDMLLSGPEWQFDCFVRDMKRKKEV